MGCAGSNSTKLNDEGLKEEGFPVISERLPTRTFANKIKEIQSYLKMSGVHSEIVWCVIELNDHSIASSSSNSICITKINYENKSWNILIKKQNAHDGHIYSLCQATNDRIISASSDHTIKIWEKSSNDLILLSTINKHTDSVMKVIALPKKKFASCSDDRSIRIFNAKDFNNELTITEQDKVCSLLFIDSKDMIISSVTDGYSNKALNCWNAYNGKEMGSIKNVCSVNRDGMVQLNKQLIAIADEDAIVIVNIEKFVVWKEIESREFIGKRGIGASIAVLQESSSFLYGYRGVFVQLNLQDQDIILQQKVDEDDVSGNTMVATQQGKFVIVGDGECGIHVYKIIV